MLWYNLDRYITGSYVHRACKVDILLPGIMNIPTVPRDKILHIDRLPLMPLIPLIMLKLQAWEDHTHALQRYQRQKQWTDVADLQRLLPIAVRRRENVANEAWIPSSFLQAAKKRLERYLVQYPEQIHLWKQVGLKPTTRSTGKESSLESRFASLSLVSLERSAPSVINIG